MSKYIWIITRDIIDEGKAVGTYGPSTAGDKPDPEKLPDYFRLKDDDDEVYFYGKTDALTNSLKDLKSNVFGFEPLEDWGEAFGCTTIEYKNPKTEQWEVL